MIPQYPIRFRTLKDALEVYENPFAVLRAVIECEILILEMEGQG